MTSVTVPVSLGGSGLEYTDGTGTRGMASMNGWGFATYLFPMLAEVMTALQAGVDAAGTSSTDATAAAAAADQTQALFNRIYLGAF
jgi:hypothetical protein